ncbi:amidohydrolase family protein [Streptomyces sp. Ru62]|uniref:amidohydrolase family protein n=1 Tax=Streptomyces sp. Ru62 TaxID=2080745 RepID=UPI000D1CB3BE
MGDAGALPATLVLQVAAGPVHVGRPVERAVDAPLTPLGLHLHLALRALHRFGGLSAAQALRTATAAPARLSGVADDLGSLERGRLAELTVIDGDPFHDVDGLVRTSWVMRDGVVRRRGDLDGPRGQRADRLHPAPVPTRTCSPPG